MRCRRCHSKLDPSKKMCPVCGTLVRKPRGSLKLAREAGGSALDNMISRSRRGSGRFDPKILLAVLLGGALIAAAVLTFNCGDNTSCGSCESLEACAMVRSSCDSCTSSCDSCASSCSANIEACAESCKRPERAVSGSDSISASDLASDSDSMPAKPARRPVEDVGVKKHGSSCGGRNTDESKYEDSVDSVPYGRECTCGDTLYYANSSGVYFLTDSNETGLIFSGKGISWLHIEDGRLFFLADGDISSVNMDGGDLKTQVKASDNGLERIIGYGLSDGIICFWGRNDDDEMLVFSCPQDGGVEAERLHRGECVQQQVYRGSVYFLSRDEKDFNTLYSVPLRGGHAQRMLAVPVTYFALCRGEIFAYTWIDSTPSLYSVDCNSLEVTHSWEFIAIRGITANDEYVYYYCNDADGIGSIFRMSPDGTGSCKLFTDNSVIQLNHVSGRRISVYSGINEDAENRYEGARYLIIDLDSGDKLRV